jgi:hypothetical protein
MIVPGSSSRNRNSHPDDCRRHLLSLGSIIESRWPGRAHGLGRILGPGGISKTQDLAIRDILASLPRLATDAAGVSASFDQAVPDLAKAIDLVIEAGFALIGDDDLSRPYPTPVMVMEPEPDGSLALNTLESPTSGSLVCRLLVGLEAIGLALAPAGETTKVMARTTQERMA